MNEKELPLPSIDSTYIPDYNGDGGVKELDGVEII